MAVKHEQQAPTQKAKRPASKSHKKKAKPTDLQLNGHSAGGENKPSQDLPPPSKKAKNSHKPSQSISTKRSPSNGISRANQHPPSPAKSPPDLPDDFEIHDYSENFLALCHEQDVPNLHENSYASLMVPSTMAAWLREPKKLQKEAGVDPEEVFSRLPTDIEAKQRPLNVESKIIPHLPDKNLQWQYLVSPTAVNKDVPLMELIGQIGIQKMYCEEPENRWEAMTSPMPFVFFHPLLPLYIDTREMGSRARYVRRSCDPNASLDTFLSDRDEYQFWLVSDKPIAANEQVTLPWDLRLAKDRGGVRILRLLGLTEDANTATEEHIEPEEYTTITTWVRTFLAEYGGCACDLGPNCAFARFHRNYFAQQRPSLPVPPKKKTSRKSKAQAISPTSTGPATNSRAASEGQHDESHDHDGRSTSGSRSKPPSRDMTPARQGSFDTLGILTEPTDRDKRKVAMVEDSFRRLEQQPPRKKKQRISDGTASGTTAAGTGHSTAVANPKKGRNSTSQASGPSRQYVDASTSGSKPGSKTGSPTTAMSSTLTKPPPSHNASRAGSTMQTSRHVSVAGALYPSRPHYCDAGSQTDFPGYEGLLLHPSHFVKRPHRRIVSLNKRIFENNRHMRAEIARREKLEAEHAAQQAATQQLLPVAMEVDAATAPPLPTPPATAPTDQPSTSAVSEDAPMPDASSVSPTTSKPAPILTNGPLSLGPIKTKSPELRVQLPPVPAFNSASTASATTPMSASSIIQSPFGSGLVSPFGPPTVNGITNPSPVKKKLSLSDYTKNRKAAAASRPSVGTNLKPGTSIPEDPKSASSVDMVVESPVVEKPVDAAAVGTIATAAPVNGAAL